MTAIVSVETVLLVLLLVLVAGLLRSHAEILRRLESAAPAAPPAPPHERRRASAAGSDVPAAPAVAGVTPRGDAVGLDFSGASTAPTLLAFLSSGCSTCRSFWETIAERPLPAGIRPVIVTRGQDRERPKRIAELAPRKVAVVMSSNAWEEYGVPGAPYFVLVDGGIRGEGAASTWQSLVSLLGDALEDGPGAAARPSIDETFAAAGISPDDPSLYPAEHR